MAFSKEYTYWHLTPNGWVKGGSKTDYGNIDSIPTPIDIVLTIKYEEYMGSSFSKVKVTEEISFEITDKNLIDKLKTMYPFNPHL